MVNALIYAPLLGILPCVFWLFFWLREDRSHPEPKRLILACFIAGMSMTVLALPLEYLVTKFIDINAKRDLAIFFWASIEEILKFGAFYLIAYRSRHDDEPIDNIIYILAVALGFSAFENMLFLLHPFWHNELATGLITTNLRFIGASLLHTLSSGIIGIFAAFAFYRSSFHKLINIICGIIFAITVHTFFNINISNQTDTNQTVFLSFTLVWLGIIGIIVIIEKVKTLTK